MTYCRTRIAWLEHKLPRLEEGRIADSAISLNRGENRRLGTRPDEQVHAQHDEHNR